jgi:hypothetical protein
LGLGGSASSFFCPPAAPARPRKTSLQKKSTPSPFPPPSTTTTTTTSTKTSFFEDYKKNEHKEVKVDDILGATEARKVVVDALNLYQQEYVASKLRTHYN